MVCEDHCGAFEILLTKLGMTDEAMIHLNQVMMMETFALADSGWLANFHDRQSKFETYKTRLLRLDLLAQRGSKDLIDHSLRKFLRSFWFFVRSKGSANENAKHGSNLEARLKSSYQNTTLIAEFSARFIFALIAGSSLIIPLVSLINQTRKTTQVATTVSFIVLFSLLVSLLSKASNQEIMAATAAYAAVLVVFISNNPGTCSDK
jgi:hypothetical protein